MPFLLNLCKVSTNKEASTQTSQDLCGETHSNDHIKEISKEELFGPDHQANLITCDFLLLSKSQNYVIKTCLMDKKYSQNIFQNICRQLISFISYI